jgi:hypothetical protein
MQNDESPLSVVGRHPQNWPMASPHVLFWFAQLPKTSQIWKGTLAAFAALPDNLKLAATSGAA